MGLQRLSLYKIYFLNIKVKDCLSFYSIYKHGWKEYEKTYKNEWSYSKNKSCMHGDMTKTKWQSENLVTVQLEVSNRVR